MRLNRSGDSVTTDIISSPLELSPAMARPAASQDLVETLRRCEETGRSIFLFGGDAASIRALRGRVAADHPRLRIAGICDADFGGPAGPAILAHIAACAPDIVIVDLSSTRHRALIAEVAACGLRFTLLNRPGSFAPHAGVAGQAGRVPGAGLAARLAGDFASLRSFAGILLRQWLQQRGPKLSVRE